MEEFQINQARTPHYKIRKIHQQKLFETLKIERQHLKEKDTWYVIDGKINFFKPRTDYRLCTELFCSLYGKKIGLDMLDYSLAYITDASYGKHKEKKIGLISENFQTKENHYYMVSELLKPNISLLMSYGAYSLKNLLSFMEARCSKESQIKTKQSLIDLYIFDYFTNQTDRNPKNITFKVKMNTAEEKHDTVFHSRDLIDLELCPIYDSEKSFGGRVKHGEIIKKPTVKWGDKFPYSPREPDTNEGIPSNLLDMVCEYPNESLKMLTMLSKGDEYEEVIENNFTGDNQLIISGEGIEHINHGLTERKKVLKQTISLIK